MRIVLLSLSLVLLLCPPSGAQEIVAHVQTDQQEWEWVGAVPSEFVKEGQRVETELGWTQEVHLTDLGGCLDPIETTSFGTVKALFD